MWRSQLFASLASRGAPHTPTSIHTDAPGNVLWKMSCGKHTAPMLRRSARATVGTCTTASTQQRPTQPNKQTTSRKRLCQHSGAVGTAHRWERREYARRWWSKVCLGGSIQMDHRRGWCGNTTCSYVDGVEWVGHPHLLRCTCSRHKPVFTEAAVHNDHHTAQHHT